MMVVTVVLWCYNEYYVVIVVTVVLWCYYGYCVVIVVTVGTVVLLCILCGDCSNSGHCGVIMDTMW